MDPVGVQGRQDGRSQRSLWFPTPSLPKALRCSPSFLLPTVMSPVTYRFAQCLLHALLLSALSSAQGSGVGWQVREKPTWPLGTGGMSRPSPYKKLSWTPATPVRAEVLGAHSQGLPIVHERPGTPCVLLTQPSHTMFNCWTWNSLRTISQQLS